MKLAIILLTNTRNVLKFYMCWLRPWSITESFAVCMLAEYGHIICLPPLYVQKHVFGHYVWTKAPRNRIFGIWDYRFEDQEIRRHHLFCQLVCLSIHPSIHQFVSPSISQFVLLSVHVIVCLSIHLFVSFSIFRVYLSRTITTTCGCSCLVHAAI